MLIWTSHTKKVNQAACPYWRYESQFKIEKEERYTMKSRCDKGGEMKLEMCYISTVEVSN
jgi:hypothetical protein